MADRFVKGTLILTAAGLMVKILASVNRIFLSRLLGGEGIGLYQLAYPLYNLLVGIVAAGIPAAMSLIVARYAAQKEWGSVRRVVTVSFPFLVFLGLAVSLAAILRACPVFDRAPCRVAGLFPGLSGNAAYGTFPDFGTILPRRLYAGPFGVAAPEGPCHGGRRGYFWSSSGGPDWAALPSFLLPAPAACLEAGGQGLDP